MNEKHIEDIITALYDMIQDARAMPLGADKCILERDKALDMLDEIIAQLPAELKQSRTIVESRNELIGQARREAEGIIRQAQEQAKQLVTKEAIYIEARKRAEELVGQTQRRIDALKKASNEYMDEALRRTEETIADADILYMTRVQRERFTDLMEYERVKDVYILKADMLEGTRDNLRILHPLPRVNEIATDVDESPKAYYFQQAKNGLYVREALICDCLGIEI